MSAHAPIPRQAGLAMVEFAVTMPVLLLLLFGTVEFSHFLLNYSTLNNSVRVAARYVAGAAFKGTDGRLVTGAAWTTLVTQGQKLAVFGNILGNGAPLLPGLNVGQITVNEDTDNLNVTVAAAYPYRSVFGAAIPTFSPEGGDLSTTYTLTLSTTMGAL